MSKGNIVCHLFRGEHKDLKRLRQPIQVLRAVTIPPTDWGRMKGSAQNPEDRRETPQGSTTWHTPLDSTTAAREGLPPLQQVAHSSPEVAHSSPLPDVGYKPLEEIVHAACTDRYAQCHTESSMPCTAYAVQRTQWYVCTERNTSAHEKSQSNILNMTVMLRDNVVDEEKVNDDCSRRSRWLLGTNEKYIKGPNIEPITVYG